LVALSLGYPADRSTRTGALAAVRGRSLAPVAEGARRYLVRLGALRSSRVGAVLATAGAAGAGTFAAAGPVAGLIAGTYAGLAARGLLRRQAARARAAQRAGALDSLSALAADLRAGLPPAAAAPILAGSPSSVAVTGGGSSAGRLSELASAAWRLAEQTGAPLADLLERVEADARALDRTAHSAAAQAAGARATAWLLAGLPLGGIALGYGIGVDPLHVLLRTPLGAACAVGALTLQVAGLAWADRLTAVTGRPA